MIDKLYWDKESEAFAKVVDIEVDDNVATDRYTAIVTVSYLHRELDYIVRVDFVDFVDRFEPWNDYAVTKLHEWHEDLGFLGHNFAQVYNIDIVYERDDDRVCLLLTYECDGEEVERLAPFNREGFKDLMVEILENDNLLILEALKQNEAYLSECTKCEDVEPESVEEEVITEQGDPFEWAKLFIKAIRDKEDKNPFIPITPVPRYDWLQEYYKRQKQQTGIGGIGSGWYKSSDFWGIARF